MLAKKLVSKDGLHLLITCEYFGQNKKQFKEENFKLMLEKQITEQLSFHEIDVGKNKSLNKYLFQ